jgi:hypothetical protein
MDEVSVSFINHQAEREARRYACKESKDYRYYRYKKCF